MSYNSYHEIIGIIGRVCCELEEPDLLRVLQLAAQLRDLHRSASPEMAALPARPELLH